MSLTKEEIINNEPRELEVPGVGTIKVRDPTTKDRIEARREARENPSWKDMSEDEKRAEEQTRLCLRIIVEPKLSQEDLEKSNDVKMFAILDTVFMDYLLRVKDLMDRRRPLIDRFLSEMTLLASKNITGS